MSEGPDRTTMPLAHDAPAPVSITVDGEILAARPGTPVAAALLAKGLRICRTTVGTGAPRGIFCATGVCGDCTMQVDGIPGVRTCVTPVRAGMRVETQHGLGEWRPQADDASEMP